MTAGASQKVYLLHSCPSRVPRPPEWCLNMEIRSYQYHCLNPSNTFLLKLQLKSKFLIAYKAHVKWTSPLLWSHLLATAATLDSFLFLTIFCPRTFAPTPLCAWNGLPRFNYDCHLLEVSCQPKSHLIEKIIWSCPILVVFFLISYFIFLKALTTFWNDHDDILTSFLCDFSH